MNNLKNRLVRNWLTTALGFIIVAAGIVLNYFDKIDGTTALGIITLGATTALTKYKADPE